MHFGYSLLYLLVSPFHFYQLHLLLTLLICNAELYIKLEEKKIHFGRRKVERKALTRVISMQRAESTHSTLLGGMRSGPPSLTGWFYLINFCGATVGRRDGSGYCGEGGMGVATVGRGMRTSHPFVLFIP